MRIFSTVNKNYLITYNYYLLSPFIRKLEYFTIFFNYLYFLKDNAFIYIIGYCVLSLSKISNFVVDSVFAEYTITLTDFSHIITLYNRLFAYNHTNSYDF